MNEAERRQCTDPSRMLEFLNTGRAKRVGLRRARKLRLYACGCCRRIGHLLPEGPFRHVVETAESYADETASPKDLGNAARASQGAALPYEATTTEKIRSVIRSVSTIPRDRENIGAMVLLALKAGWQVGDLLSVPRATYTAAQAQHFAYLAAWSSPSFRDEQQIRANLVRDVLPTPFQAIRFDPAWLSWCDETVRRMAQTMYTEHRGEDLPILADALEEAGCDNADILAHCRGPGPHIRGCWVLDLLLGK